MLAGMSEANRRQVPVERGELDVLVGGSDELSMRLAAWLLRSE